MNRDEIISSVTSLIEKYEGDKLMETKLQTHVVETLPAMLAEYKANYKERKKRIKDLSDKSERFITRFVAKNNIYYTSHNELFVKYNGKHFEGYSEDNIQHNALTQITASYELRQWKHKVKNAIVKRIKNRSPLNAIPESYTIQYVINQLCPALFPTKTAAKYFLTVIGDGLMHKEDTTLIYIAHPYLKAFINEINLQAHAYFGITNALQQIKFKFYDHPFKSSRLLSKKYSSAIHVPWDMYKHMLDLLCVSAHYSVRYNSADGYLQKCGNKNVSDHALLLNNNTPDSMVDLFLKRYIKKSDQSVINTKNMIFIWKKFLDELDVTNIIFHGSLHAMFRKKLSYDESQDAYMGVTSIYLPTMATFMQFWQNTIEVDDESEIEIEELPILFVKWEKQNKTKQNHSIISDNELFLDLVKHFYPDIAIEEDKYLLNIKCSLWNKRDEVISLLESFRQKNTASSEIEPSLNGAYMFYTGQAKKNEFVVSKRYFEKVALEEIKQHMDDDGLIDSKWFSMDD